jgi:hypothetical protein
MLVLTDAGPTGVRENHSTKFFQRLELSVSLLKISIDYKELIKGMLAAIVALICSEPGVIVNSAFALRP